MEPENHPFAKENHLPELQNDCVQNIDCQGCNLYPGNPKPNKVAGV